MGGRHGWQGGPSNGGWGGVCWRGRWREVACSREGFELIKDSNWEERRETIFHTRCTINGCVCSLIVNGGSCANVTSTTLVEKLQLKVEPHPHLYSIQWLNQGKGLQVSTRCLINFSIGKSYLDKLWRDIIPMDACHILLGRPWLYDWKVMHDGHLNMYTLHKNGRKSP